MTDSSPAGRRALADQRYEEMRELLRTSVQDGTYDRTVQARTLALQAEAYDLRQSAKQDEHDARMRTERRKRWWRRR